MPCLIILLLLGLPRLVLFTLWLFGGDYVSRPFDGSNFFPFLGFLFLPFTTVAWVWAKNSYGAVEGLGMAAVIVALLLDLGMLGGASRRRRQAQ